MNLRNDSEHVTQVGAGVQRYCCIMHRAAHNSPRLDTKHILDGVLCTTIAIMLLLSVTVPYRLPRDLLSGVGKLEKQQGYLWRRSFAKFRYSIVFGLALVILKFNYYTSDSDAIIMIANFGASQALCELWFVWRKSSILLMVLLLFISFSKDSQNG